MIGTCRYGALDGDSLVTLSDDETWAKCVGELSNSLIIDPELPRMPLRSQGRPRLRWDDLLTAFCANILYANNYWIDLILPHVHNNDIEDDFVSFCCAHIGSLFCASHTSVPSPGRARAYGLCFCYLSKSLIMMQEYDYIQVWQCLDGD